MRHVISSLGFLGAVLSSMAACSSDSGSGQQGTGVNGGGASGSGAAPSTGGSSGNGGGQNIGGASGMGGGGGTTGSTGGTSGNQCTTTADCPQPGCYMCPGYVCANGKCVPEGNIGSGGASGTLKWYSTCGPPVCSGIAGAPGGGGSSSSLPVCTSTETKGAPCSIADAECDMGAPCAGPLKCTTSDPTHGNCPISRAKYKTDIEYLSAEERSKLADDVQSIPLVRYRYKDGPERQHLGFIIEDVEPSPSVDSQHDQVDLYGYTSMAIAALQEQRREIDSLKAEIGQLRGQLAKRKPSAAK